MKTMEATTMKGTKSHSGAAAKTEGPVAKFIEEQTAKLPSDLFLWTAIGCMGVSLALKIFSKDENGLFIGQWVAPFLLFGIYNKIVKVEGHDRLSK